MADNLTPEQRRKTMAAVKGKDTSLERTLLTAFKTRRWCLERNVADLPGKPDFVFRKARVAVFVDGDFWHGWRFPAWKAKLAAYWQTKIERNRRRDRKNFQQLRRDGWRVLRVWEHEVERGLADVVERVASLLASGTVSASRTRPVVGRLSTD